MDIIKSYLPEEAVDSIKRKVIADGCSVVVSGASISYNRYSFDPTPRQNAYQCYPGMPSWSFLLRDALKQNDRDYVFGDEITYLNSTFFRGMDKDLGGEPERKYAAMNHGKIAGFEVEKGSTIRFSYKFSESERDRVVLYLQKRPSGYGESFDILVDGEIKYRNISNRGNPELFMGYEPFEIDLSPLVPGREYEIGIGNIKCDGKAVINIQGVGSKKTHVHLTGRGNQTTDYFVEDLDIRILRFNPDVLIFTTGANDRARISCEKFGENLENIISRTKKALPHCDIITMGAPYSENYTWEHRNSYLNMLRDKCEKYGLIFLNPEEIFNEFEIEKWRFDNVHLTRFGNTHLANYIARILFSEDSHYRKEYMDSDLWFE